MLHDDRGATEVDREGYPSMRRRMIEWRRRQVGHAVAKPPQLHQEIVDWELLRRRLVRQRPQDVLWPARRAGGIQHRGAKRFVGDRRFGKRSGGLVEILRAAVTGAVDNQAE